jgi:tetratricopeptide (TPR) repeat protein
MKMNKVAQKTVDLILDQQSKAWREGSRPSVEDVLRDSSLPTEPDVLLDLIYNEIVVREEIGERPSLDEYLLRFPCLDEDLKLHFDVHRAVHENLLIDTHRLDDGGAIEDIEPHLVDIYPELTDYEIIGELGSGGMGVVYKARHHRLRRFVALKMFQPGHRPSPRELQRFRAEAESIARLQHPNIVQIFEVGEENGLPFLALELAENGTLQQKLNDLVLAPRAAAELIETLARAVQNAHEQKIIHRDLKPANVLFGADGVPKITDFGLAKLLEEDADSPRDATRTGEPIGTPRYMSPEQADAKPGRIGPATDVYSLGTMLYECLTGQVPFVSATVVETVDRIRHEEPTSPRRLQPAIPRDLETICLYCLHKNPERRYASAQALAEDLRRFLKGEPIQARRTPWWEKTWMWCRRRPALATLLGGALTLFVCVLIILAVREYREHQRIEALRLEVTALVQTGQHALNRGEGRDAKERFQEALAKVHAEPALRDFELGVRGWLDHSHRQADLQRIRQRQQPPLFDQRRDDAFVQYLLADPRRPDSLRAAHEAIGGALEFTIADDQAWRLEREALFLIEADLAMRDGNAKKALTILDAANPVITRMGANRRAAYLQAVGRDEESKAEQVRAAKLAPRPAFESLLRGLEKMRTQQFDAAARDFDDALFHEPDHFLARLLQGVCLLREKKAAEAKIAFTACLGQQPRFVWCVIFRSQAYAQLGNLVAAAQDLQTASEMSLHDSARLHLHEAMQALKVSVDQLPSQRLQEFWATEITTANGPQKVANASFGRMLKKG